MSTVKFRKVPELFPNRKVRIVRTEQLWSKFIVHCRRKVLLNWSVWPRVRASLIINCLQKRSHETRNSDYCMLLHCSWQSEKFVLLRNIIDRTVNAFHLVMPVW